MKFRVRVYQQTNDRSQTNHSTVCDLLQVILLTLLRATTNGSRVL